MKGQLRISRVRRPRATLLAILMLGGVYCSLGLWVHGYIVMEDNPSVQIAEEKFAQEITGQIEQLSQFLVTVAHKPSAQTIRVVTHPL